MNGETKSVVITEDKPLLYVIRDDFNLTGTKLGCGLLLSNVEKHYLDKTMVGLDLVIDGNKRF